MHIYLHNTFDLHYRISQHQELDGKKTMDDLGGTPVQNHHTLALMKDLALDVVNHVPSGNLK